ncbi:high affinity cAMP-specific and IBMX-insensitive 3',5'-cyclic phosphodiesterase 8A-like isoform X2 [Watersipora subatra]|uniref:high affinity cAMP-specific and IBMX-insensitive 3',5'-cyclic phosphodiesterase 8A-like isoform X2 n=1 Tax=Watersipora subatra TaxID=2589382 RepID=UPI00355C8A41
MSWVSRAAGKCNRTGSELTSGNVTPYIAKLGGNSELSHSKVRARQWYLSNNNCLELNNTGQLVRPSEIKSLRNGISSDGDNNISSGKMKLWMTNVTVLMVFGKEDAQSDTLKKAADKAGFGVTLVKSAEAAIESYVNNQQDLIIIDCRHSLYFEHDNLCRSLKSKYPKGYSRFLAITSNKRDKDEPSIIPYLQSGFTRRMVECTNIATVFNELVSIERGEIRPQQQLQAYNTLSLALQNIDESVEITDNKFRTEFVNGAFEKATGYTAKDVVGTYAQDRLQVDNCNEEQTMVYHMKKNEHWEGIQSVRRKNGDTIQCRCKIVPVEMAPGKVSKYILLRNQLSMEEPWDRFKEFETRNRGTSGIINFKRTESRRRIHSLTIEAPITKVISMLNDAQNSSPSNLRVVEAIDKVLEILQTTELFAPHIHQVKEEDSLAHDYVEGLCDKTRRNNRTMPGLQQKRSQSSRLSSGQKQQPSNQHMTPEIEQQLELNTSWYFDILSFESLTNQNALVLLGLKIFQRFDVMSYLEVDEMVVVNWLQLIGSNYRSQNSYHNATHAADVLQATAFFLDKIRPKYFLEQHHEVAALIAAVIHDVDHPARTSSFLINCKDKLAILYNDTSVLENHHAATGFQLTHQNPKTDIFIKLERKKYDIIRKTIIDMVIYTDMGRHFETVEKFSLLCSLNRFLPSGNCSQTEETSTIQSKRGTGLVYLPIPVEPTSIPVTDENCTQVLRMCIKVADVSNPARDRQLMTTWAYRIAEEYFDQYDEEQKRNIPAAMPTFRRSDCNIPKSQLGFTELFLDKMFTCWNAFLDIPEVIGQLQDNYNYWQDENVEEDGGSNPSVTNSVS